MTKPKWCKGCGRSVRQTVGNCGFCKRCIARAQEDRKAKEALKAVLAMTQTPLDGGAI